MNAHALINPRRTCQPVRRDSFDINDRRADVFRPIEHGIVFVDKYLDVFDDWRNLIKKKGEQHSLNGNCRAVLATILRRCLDFKRGTCEPSLDALMRLTRLSRATIVRCLKQLSVHGFIDWVRRTERTGNRPGEGPLVRQVSNAYFFDSARLPQRCLKRLREVLKRKGKKFEPPAYPMPAYEGLRERRRRTMRQDRANLAAGLENATTPAEKARILYPDDEDQRAAFLDMLTGRASSPSGLNPSLRIKIQKE